MPIASIERANLVYNIHKSGYVQLHPATRYGGVAWPPLATDSPGYELPILYYV
jgi:hypothetical protein